MFRMENNLNFTVAAVLPAGGTGQRMGLPIPKQVHSMTNMSMSGLFRPIINSRISMIFIADLSYSQS